MKKLLEASGWVIILMFIFGSAQAQTWSPSGVYTKPLGVWPANTLRLPSDTVNYKTGLAQIGGVLYVGDGTKWTASAGGGVQYSDTAAMLAPYQRSAFAMKYSDTALMLSHYYNRTFTDALLALKLNISDTASMLSPYLRSFLGVKYTDTAAMLSPYLLSFLGVKYSDTSSMLNPYKKAYYTIGYGLDSTQITIKSINGTQVDTIKFNGGSGLLGGVVQSGSYHITSIIDSGFYQYPTSTDLRLNIEVPNNDLITYQRVGDIVSFTAQITLGSSTGRYDSIQALGQVPALFCSLPIFEKTYISNFAATAINTNLNLIWAVAKLPNLLMIHFGRGDFVGVPINTYITGHYQLK